MAATNVTSLTSFSYRIMKSTGAGKGEERVVQINNAFTRKYFDLWLVAVCSQKCGFFLLLFWFFCCLWILRNFYATHMVITNCWSSWRKTSAKLTGMVQFQFGFRFYQSICKKWEEIIKAPPVVLSEQFTENQLWIIW